VLRHVPRPVEVQFDGMYREIGIRSHGKGLFHKAPISGAELGDKRVFFVEPGDFVLNIVFAWEGAVGLVSEGDRGMIASHRFPTFRSDEQRLDLRFLLLFFRTPTGVDLMGRVSPGGAGRNRTLNRTAFLSLDIPLPPLIEQQRLVAGIEAIAGDVKVAVELQEQSTIDVSLLGSKVARELFTQGSEHQVGEFVSFQTGYAFKSEWFSHTGVRLARNTNVSHGRLDWGDTARLPAEMSVGFTRFELQEGDILISLDRPLISTGVKVARVQPVDLPALLVQRVARAQVDDRLCTDYLYHWLHSPAFAEALDPGRSNGVPHISHKDIERLSIVVPDVRKQRRVVAEMEELKAQAGALAAAQAARRAELDALMPAILDRAFAGAL
jgi:type I restriction enzyme, S subunit